MQPNMEKNEQKHSLYCLGGLAPTQVKDLAWVKIDLTVSYSTTDRAIILKNVAIVHWMDGWMDLLSGTGVVTLEFPV